MNTFYHGDCLFVMNHDIEPNTVDLIYLDPPFFTGKVQKGTARWNPGAMEISYEDSKRFWGDTEKLKAMREKAPEWLSYIAIQRPQLASYLYYMMVRLKACHRVLSPTGTIYLHCNWRAVHYLKMIMDEIFGYDNFRNELIWSYNSGSRGKTDFGHRHDTILRYSKTKQYLFTKDDSLRQPYSPNINIPKCKAHYYNPKGKIVGDVWAMPILAQNDKKERVGYPDQKPLALLERIIKASSKEGDLILDPFCGCGTTIIEAQKTNRKWIGIDIKKDAQDISGIRHGELPLDFSTRFDCVSRDLEEVSHLNPHDFEVWVNEFYKATKPMPDKGVDGITPTGTPIQTKTFTVSRKFVDEFNSSIKYHQAVKQPVTSGIIVSQTGFDESATKRQFEIEHTDHIKIEFKTPADMLKLE